MLDLSEQKRTDGERKRAEEAVQKMQAELTHITRLTTLGELTASIAHEINQPLAAVVTNANASLRWLAGNSPNLAEACESIRHSRTFNRVIRPALSHLTAPNFPQQKSKLATAFHNLENQLTNYFAEKRAA